MAQWFGVATAILINGVLLVSGSLLVLLLRGELRTWNSGQHSTSPTPASAGE
jgi:hypothetical protein